MNHSPSFDEELAMAQRHAEEGAGLLKRQREIIMELERDGHDATRAREMLKVFEESQRLHEAHVAKLLAQ